MPILKKSSICKLISIKENTEIAQCLKHRYVSACERTTDVRARLSTKAEARLKRTLPDRSIEANNGVDMEAPSDGLEGLQCIDRAYRIVKGGRRIVNMHEEDEPTTSKKPRTKVVEEERQMRETEEMGGDARKSLEKRILFQREKDIMALKDLKSLKARHE
ncbi:hypothetical protein Tco_0615048 [Tanacetum coccineum]